MNKGFLIVISGAAGSGKGTIVRKLAGNSNDFHTSISYTTRAPRGDDIPDVTYHFVTVEKFKEMIANDEFAEYAIYRENFYGTPMLELDEPLREGKNVILEIDTHGALQIKKHYPEAIMIWITPPDYETLERRLRARATNTEDDILKRLATSQKELQLLDYYDYIIVNNDGEADKAADQIRQILRVKQLSVASNKDFHHTFYKTNNH